MPGTSGALPATAARTSPSRPATSPAKSPVMRTWINTVPGPISPVMAMSGCRTASLPVGHLTAMATGPGSLLGAGRGSTMRRGASRHITTAAGPRSATVGAGSRARAACLLLTLRPSSPGLAALVSPPPSAGSPSVRGNRTFRPIRSARTTSAASTVPTRSSTTPPSTATTRTARSTASNIETATRQMALPPFRRTTSPPAAEPLKTDAPCCHPSLATRKSSTTPTSRRGGKACSGSAGQGPPLHPRAPSIGRSSPALRLRKRPCRSAASRSS